MLKDVTLRPSVVYDYVDFAEVMEFMAEGTGSNQLSSSNKFYREIHRVRKDGNG